MKHSKDTIELVRIMLRHSSIRQIALCLGLTKGQVSRIKASYIDGVSRVGERQRLAQQVLSSSRAPSVPFVPHMPVCTKYYNMVV